MSKATKTRNWAGIIYPDSAPSDWLDVLKDLRMKVLVSPLHDKDVDEDGNAKKPHHHIILIFDGPQTQNRVSEIFTALGGVATIQRVNSLSSHTRYLAHLDNPEKAQYSPDDIIAFGGIDPIDLLGSSRSSAEMTALINEICDKCAELGIVEFSKLIDYTRKEQPNWLFFAYNNVHFFDRYLSSCRHIRNMENRR
ncbi:MAG: replication protein [Coriobacteriia bacterium]|nr:replication protein [Coriobacteriia bacterium]MCL2870644.1 replication protein [Coriobacteriia bacterium]